LLRLASSFKEDINETASDKINNRTRKSIRLDLILFLFIAIIGVATIEKRIVV
jgi:hypothetical protein